MLTQSQAQMEHGGQDRETAFEPQNFPTLSLRLASLATLADPVAKPSAEPVAKLTPAQIRKSVTVDGLVSFEDGKTYKMLKRHLGVFGLTPAAYRQKWGLPADYPMVLPSASLARSASAKARGFGRTPTKSEAAPVLTIDQAAGEEVA